MDEIKICPITKQYCIEDKCAWWINTTKCCSVTQLAITVRQIAKETKRY